MYVCLWGTKPPPLGEYHGQDPAQHHPHRAEERPRPRPRCRRYPRRRLGPRVFHRFARLVRGRQGDHRRQRQEGAGSGFEQHHRHRLQGSSQRRRVSQTSKNLIALQTA